MARYRSIPQRAGKLAESKLPERLVQAMDDMDFTPLQLGDRLGVTRSCVYNWMNGKQWPGFETAIALARVLDVSLDWLAGLTD